MYWVECIEDPSTKMLLAGTVIDIPFSVNVSDDSAAFLDRLYTVLFNNGTSASIPLSEMADIIPKPPVDLHMTDSQDSLLSPFLCLNSKITYEHDSQYYKGYLGKTEWGLPFHF